MRGEEEGKPPIYKREARRSRGRATRQQLFHFALYLRERRFECPASWIDDDFALWTQLIEPEADGLADPAFDAIARHRFADRARHGKADLRSQAVRAPDKESGEQRP